MITLSEYMNVIEERKNSFDRQCNALRLNRNLTGLAALYMDLLTSSLGEKWDTKELLLELDDILDELKSQNVLFFGNPISDRRTDKDDPYVLKFIETVPKTTKLKDENNVELRDASGKVLKQTNGTKDVTRKKHIHMETYEFVNPKMTNAFGIPAFKIYGEFHMGGYYPTVATYNAVRNLERRNALKISTSKNFGALREEYKDHEKIQTLFFEDIEERCRYGLSAFGEITVANNSAPKRAGLVRLDFDIDEENGNPVVAHAIFLFDSAAFIRGHVSVDNLVNNAIMFVKQKAFDCGMAFSEHFKRTILTDGGYERFEKVVSSAEENARRQVELEKKRVTRMHEALLLQEQQELERARKEAERRAEEKERLKEEREQERVRKAAEKAERAVEKHNKAVENMMTTLVTSIIQAGGTPGRSVYQSMREEIENDVTSGVESMEDVELIFEALDKLIEADPNA